MRLLFPIVVVGVFAGGLVTAQTAADQTAADQTAADQIRSLYESVPFDLVRASPEADIAAHLEEMSRRRAAPDDSFAVPDLDIQTILRDQGSQDVLMDPRILEAIARMPPGRAAEVLRLIEEHRAGLDPLNNVPALSLPEETEPVNLSLKGWVLDRDASGAPYIQLGSDPASRLMIVPSMILGDMGRVLTIQDDMDAFRVTMETGDVLEGGVRKTAGSSDPDPASDGVETAGIPAPDVPSPDGTEDQAAVSGAVLSSIRPRARPEGLGAPSAGDPAVMEAPVASPAEASFEVSGADDEPPVVPEADPVRPRPRPQPPSAEEQTDVE
jgi:hypothetical protein